ncbi:MAG: BatA domain-containing protein, partial [Pseudomonadota bacterium]
MFGLPIAFASPWILLGLISLPIIWWLLRLTPPRPQEETFPPTRILARLQEKEETPAQSPWWLTLLRLLMAGLVIVAMAGPVLNPEESGLAGEGPVMIVIDDGWASAADWEVRRDTALSIIEEAQQAGRTIILESATNRESWNGLPMTAQEASALLQASEALPLPIAHQTTGARIRANATNIQPGQINWLSDGLERETTTELADRIAETSDNVVVYLPESAQLAIISDVRNDPSKLIGTVVRPDQNNALQLEILALDENNLALARTRVNLESQETSKEFVFDQPVELRNQFVRLEIGNSNSAGGVKLLDENNRRRLVGLISGETFDQSQPLLSPLYYISRALEPFSDIRRSGDANVTASVPDLVNQGVSVLILADVGTIPDKTVDALNSWIEKGGMLVRFAGPRLGGSPDSDLLPVEIRPGDRSLGGALSWETPKPLAAFDRESPFAGLEAPRDVLIRKQLLALQESELDKKTWSRLEDGTPLVTAERRGAGWVVLYHVGTDSDWSNLPLSGTFVEMLRRTVNLASSGKTGGESDKELVLPPLKVLDGKGLFTPPSDETKPLIIKAATKSSVSQENPPGFYGTEDGLRALNLFNDGTELTTLKMSALNSEFDQRAYIAGQEIAFKSWLLAVATLLLVADCLAVLWMSGAFRKGLAFTSKSAALIAGLALLPLAFAGAIDANAQETDFSAALETRLAYVVTGVDDVDRIPAALMRGLTRFISSRTALEPGEPVGLDVDVDELSFYSLIYWPVDPRAALPSNATMARIDAFMKQ